MDFIIPKLADLTSSARPDFAFAWEGADGDPWTHLRVVRFTAREAISAPYRYDLTLLHRGPLFLHPADLLGARATLRIATLTDPPFRLIHGVITEAEELSTVPEGTLYRATLAPPLALAEHRVRSRIFLDKTLRQILDAILAPFFERCDNAAAIGDAHPPAGFTPADARYCYRVTDTSRLDDPAARPFCVQYDESDFAFLSRLLEHEGISYHFEHGPGVCLLVLSDADEGKTRLDPFHPLGPGLHGRDVTWMRLGGRLRPRAVRLSDYDWRRPALALRAHAGADVALFEQRHPGALHGEPIARARLDRHHVEASYALGGGGVRLLSAGAVFQLDHANHDGEYLVTQLELRGEQAGVITTSSREAPEPFAASFECACRGSGAPSRFRPAMKTPKPRIQGPQTAIVTADPTAPDMEINVGGPREAEVGCVRLRFHWDTEAERHAREPTSCWVRVGHDSAGAGRGFVFHPRVGDEVIAEFQDGDPDRPVIVSRVYNGQNRPPAPAQGAPTVSTIKSIASPGGDAINEVSFDDTRGAERMGFFAGRDLSAHVGHDRSEIITNHSTSRVGVDRTEHTGGNRRTTVDGDNAEHVAGSEGKAIDGDHSVTVGANQKVIVGADQAIDIGANQTTMIGAAQSVSIGASLTTRIGADRSVDIGGSSKEAIAGSATLAVMGDRFVSVGGSQETSVGGSRAAMTGGDVLHSIGGAFAAGIAAHAEGNVGGNAAIAAGGGFAVHAGGALTLIGEAAAGVQGQTVAIVAATELLLSVGGASIRITPGSIEIAAPSVSVSGGATDVLGGLLKLN